MQGVIQTWGKHMKTAKQLVLIIQRVDNAKILSDLASRDIASLIANIPEVQGVFLIQPQVKTPKI